MTLLKEKIRNGIYDILETRGAMRVKTNLLRIKPVREFIAAHNLMFQGRLPLAAMVAITDSCQCSCAHCGVSTNSLNCGEFSLAQMFKLIDELKSLNVKRLYLFGGEPLMRKDIIEIIAYATKKRMLVEMDSNGILLNKKNVVALKNAGLQLVRVSLDSHNAKEHDRSRGLIGTFDKAIAGIKNCQEIGLECHLSSYINREKINSNHIDNLVLLNKKLGTKMRLLKPILTGKIMNAEEELFNEQEILKLRSYLRPNKVYWEVEYIDHKDIPFMCSAKLKKYIYISSFGEVQPCCYLPIVFGSVHNEPLENILTRMHGSDVYDSNVWECPMNNKDFREKFFSEHPKSNCSCFEKDECISKAA